MPREGNRSPMNPLRQNSQPSQQTFDNAMQLLRPLSSPPFPCQARRQHQKYSILHRAVCSRPAKPMNVQTGPVKGPMCSPVLEPRTSNTTLPHLRQCNTPQPAHPQMWLLPRINSPQPFKSLANAHAAIPPTSGHQETLSMQLYFPHSLPTLAWAQRTASATTSHAPAQRSLCHTNHPMLCMHLTILFMCFLNFYPQNSAPVDSLSHDFPLPPRYDATVPSSPYP